MTPSGSLSAPPRGQDGTVRERFLCVRCGLRPAARTSMWCAPCDEAPLDALPLFAPEAP
jgi:hypothetical protein